MRALSSLHINLNFFSENFRLTFRDAGARKLIPMIKANAYGHGMGEVAKHCIKNHLPEMDGFGVATLQEGIQLRQEIGEVQQDIYVFSETEFLISTSLELYGQFGLIPVISSLQQLEIFTSSSHFRHVPLVVKIDTGMKRLGISFEDLDIFFLNLKKHNRTQIYHLMSHLACSDELNHPLNSMQISKFQKCIDLVRSHNILIEKTSLSNSGSLVNNLENFCSHVRPGIRLYTDYGGGKLVSSLETEILDIKKLSAHESFGYGACSMNTEGWLAIIPVGYADGIPLSVKGYKFTTEDHIKVEFVGRINMDLSYLWSDQPLPWRNGSLIKLWSNEQNHLNFLAKHMGAHVYQVLTGISYRIPRRYH